MAGQDMNDPSTARGSGSGKEAERDWAMAAHLSALVGLLGNGVGFVLGPLVVWLWKKDEYRFVNEQGLEALNFQLTMLIALLASFVLSLTIIGLVVAIPLMFLVIVFAVVFPITAAANAKRGVHYRYPFSMRLIK